MKPSRLLSDMAPYLGKSHLYSYHGGPRETNRIGNTYAWHYVVRGSGIISVNHHCTHVNSGSLIFVRPGCIHSFEPSPSKPLTCYNLYADLWESQGSKQYRSSNPLVCLPMGYHPDLLTPSEPCEELEQLPVHASLHSWPQLVEDLGQILRMGNQTGPYIRKATNLKFHSWLLQWYHAFFSSPGDARIHSLLQWLERLTDYSCLTVDAMTEHSGLGRTQFYRLFQLELGMKPWEYILKLKMQRAALLLRESGHSVTKVAELLGYPSIHYFSTQFTKHYKINPSQYAKM